MDVGAVNQIHFVDVICNSSKRRHCDNNVSNFFTNNSAARVKRGNNKKNSRKFNAMVTSSVHTASSTSFHHPTVPLLSLFLYTLLLQNCFSWMLKPVTAIAVAETGAQITVSNGEHCAVILDNSEVKKEIGSVWISAEDPCAIHACERNETGIPHETIAKIDCSQFYCDVDSELRPLSGTCCGECVRTKCRYSDVVYEVGQTWHNQKDCMIFECIQLNSGQPMINAYKKTCPPLPPDCLPENVYVKDCCQFCNRGRSHTDLNSEQNDMESDSEEDIWTADFYRNHPCVRECQSDEQPRTCRYTFVVEWYETLSKACYACPRNATDCERPHCILGDGIPRSVMVVNRMMPGPAIEVCEGDMIEVDVHNNLLGESTTIHWHGIHQRQYPYMDGVPHISQCPISPHSTFRYRFKADNAGTHFWHSHTGMQRGDGVFGALIVRRQREKEPHSHLYDFDLSEHKMILQDWVHVPGVSMFASHHHSRGDNKPVNLLVNGRGRYYKAIWEVAKEMKVNARTVQNKQSKISTEKEEKSSLITTSHAIELTTEAQQLDFAADVDFLHPNINENQTNMRIKETGGALQMTHLLPKGVMYEAVVNASADAVHPAIQNLNFTNNKTAKVTRDNAETFSRIKRSDDSFEISLDQMPLQVYNVRRGFRYRFRIINAEFLNCPITVSIDNHTLTAIHSDGYDFEALDVGSIVTYAGERFDFILQANQPIGNYWIRFKGLMDCSEVFTSAFQVAILRYEDAAIIEPIGQLGYAHKANGIELNVMNRGPGYADTMTVAELTALPQYDAVSGIDRDALKPVADYKFFVYYDFYAKDNPDFHHSDYYGFNDTLGSNNKLYTPQLNHISLKFPPIALLPARNEINDSMFCNETDLIARGIDCRQTFCKCYHVLQVELNSIVELIVVDEGFTYDANHPFHLHGNAFRVVGLERLGANVTIEMVKQLDRYNLLKRNLNRPPVKDTVTVPDGGYTILRFEASNPGYWLFHCHIEFHAEIGMALIIKVGNNDQMQSVPKNFPTCHDYLPNAQDDSAIDGDLFPITSTTVAADKSAASLVYIQTKCILVLTLLTNFILVLLNLFK